MSKTVLTTSEIQFANAEFLPEVVKMLNEGHTVTLRLRGYSMRPFLENDRDKALLVKPTTIKVGDPVLAEITPRHFVLHRIDRIEGDNVTLRGDGNLGVEHCKKENRSRSATTASKSSTFPATLPAKSFSITPKTVF